jgi:hypothetical protein
MKGLPEKAAPFCFKSPQGILLSALPSTNSGLRVNSARNPYVVGLEDSSI